MENKLIFDKEEYTKCKYTTPTEYLFIKALYYNETGIVNMLKDAVIPITLEQIGAIRMINGEPIVTTKFDPVFLKGAQVTEIIEYFKSKSGKTRTSSISKSNREFVLARLKDGYTVEELKSVIDWADNAIRNNMFQRQYFRIETLFNETKFQGYIGNAEQYQERVNNIRMV
jgi:uncharacterized phage protein (TIGR02220 family)